MSLKILQSAVSLHFLFLSSVCLIPWTSSNNMFHCDSFGHYDSSALDIVYSATWDSVNAPKSVINIFTNNLAF